MFAKVGKIIAVLLVAVMAMALAGCSASGDGDALVMGGSRVIHADEVITGNLVVLGGDVTLEPGAAVEGDVSVMGGSVQLDGAVGGDIVVMGGSVERGARATIDGEVITLGGDYTRADLGSGLEGVIPTPGASEEVEGPVPPVPPVAPVPPVPPVRPEITLAPEPPGFVERAVGGAFSVIGKLFQAVAFGALGLVLTMFMPDHVRRIGSAAEQAPAASMGVGLLATLVITVLVGIAFIASFLIIGIPFLVLIPLATTAAWVIGMIGIGFFFGTRLLKSVDIRSPRAPAAAAIGTGTLSLVGNMVGWIPVVGWFFTPLLGFWALGATVLTRGGTQVYPARRVTHHASAPIGGGTRTAGESPAPPRPASSGNLFADLANDLGLDEEDLMDEPGK